MNIIDLGIDLHSEEASLSVSCEPQAAAYIMQVAFE